MEGFGVVKAVLSGDTLVLLGAPRGDAPPPELQLTLAGLSAPRIARHPDQRDEPFGWASREFLRAALIGKQVKFKNEGGPRNAAWLWTSTEPVTVNELVAAAGWARPTPAPASPNVERVTAAATVAQRDGLGLYARPTPADVRDITWTVTDSATLLSRYSGVGATGVVETVLNGSTFRIYLPTDGVMLTLALAGVVCPRAEAPTPTPAAAAAPTPAPAPVPVAVAVRIPASASGKGAWGKSAPTSTPTVAAATTSTAPVAAAAAAAPTPTAVAAVPVEVEVGAKAKVVSSIRVLHRTVQVVLKAVEKNGVFVGRLELPEGEDLPLHLLRNGHGRVADFTLSHCSLAAIGAMRSAQRAAQAERLGLWRDWSPTPTAVPEGEVDYAGRVVEVVSGDTLLLALPSGLERRISIASVRAPRVKGGDGPQPYGAEAKEWLRRAAVGRDAAVHVEYDTKRAETGEVRIFGTVTLQALKKGGVATDLGLALVKEGLVEVVKAGAHATGWDELVVAEGEAKAAKKGMWSGVAPHGRAMADLTHDAAKAKAHWALLTVDKSLRGVVDFIPSGGRASIAIPSHSVIISCAALGVKCPYPPKTGNATRAARDGDPLGAEALAATRAMVMQREVDVTAHSMDAHGTCVASIYVGSGAGRVSLGVDLVRRGLGYALPHICDRFPEGAEVMAAEAEARAAKRGVWALESAAAEAAAAVDAPADAAAAVSVTVADVRDGSHVFIHKDEEAAIVASVTARMDEVKAEVGTQCAYVDAAKGRVLLALFVDDAGGSTWVRARVEGKAKDAAGAVMKAADGADLYDVVHIDYGTGDRITVSSMRPCDGVWATLPPLAHPVTLAYVRVPPLGKDGGEDAARFLSDTVMGQRINMRVHGRDAVGGGMLVSLWSADGSACANEMLVEAGLARVARTEAKRLARRAGADPAAHEQDMALVRKLEEAQLHALRDRAGMFRYGDVGDSDDDTLRGAARGGAARK